MEGQDGMTMKRAEIDTSAPFRSVKEAVSLFGDKLLASHVYHPNKPQQNGAISDEPYCSNRVAPVSAELEETKQSLQKAKEDGEIMASCLSSLQRELERTKLELEQLKDSDKQILQENPNILGVGGADKHIDFKVPTTSTVLYDNDNYIGSESEFQKHMYATFGNPQSMARHVIAGCDRVLEKKKKNKKPLIPLIIGGIFTKKKGRHQVA